MFKTIIILVFSSTVLAYINFEVAPEASYKINVTKLFNIKQKWNIQSNGIYFPSIFWCGKQNDLKDLNESDYQYEADICCMHHKNCSDYINAGDSKHNLTNIITYTMLSCDCERKFLDCLKKASTPASVLVGIMYYEFFPTRRCFSEEHPKVKCLKSTGWPMSKCLKYELDEKKPKIYQWFDLPLFM